MSATTKLALIGAEPTNSRMARLENAAQKTARMLLRRNDIQVVVGSSPRYAWKEKRLYLPAYSKEAADPRLEMAWRGLTDHECAHVEHTDFDALDGAMASWAPAEQGRLLSLCNVFEDIWIEKAWGNLYPGSRHHFAVKNAYLVEKNGGSAVCDPAYVIPETGQPIGVWGALLQAVLRVGRGAVDIADVSPEIQTIMTHCQPEIQAGWDAANTSDVIGAAEALWKKLQSMSEPPPEEEQDEGGGGGAGDGEDGESGGGEADGDAEQGGDSGPEGEADGEGDVPGGKGEGEGEGEPGGKGGKGEGEADGEGDGKGGDSPGSDGEPGEGEAGEGEGEGAGESGEGDGKGGEAGSEPNAEGAGNCDAHDRELAAEACGGEWGEVKSDADVIAGQYLSEMPPLYTVHPEAMAHDRVIKYDTADRQNGREALKGLTRAAGPACAKLQNLMRGAIAASRQSLVIGGMEEGDGLDECALPGIALGLSDPGIFTTTIRQVSESTGVVVLVDCSGSMGKSTPNNGRITTKAGYAAVTAMALHKALQGVRIEHAVLGYSTCRGPRTSEIGGNPYRQGSKVHLEWSRATKGLESHVFVEAPGITDDGSALPYITGRSCNLDGESVLWGAEYGARHFGHLDRVIMLVIADGLPAGADDYTVEGSHLMQAVETVAHAGIEVYGIGVCIRDMPTFRRYYPERQASPGRAPTGSIEIRSGSGLTDGVLRQLTTMLTRGYGMTRKGGR